MKKGKIVLAVIIVAALVGGAVFGYLYHNGRTDIKKYATPKKGQIKVACVGDSVTYGHSIKNWTKNNYPTLLGNLLGEEYCVCNFGESGLTVQPDGDQPYPQSSVHTASLDFEADILIFMLGSNDSKPQNWKGKEKFKEDYLNLLNTYLQGEKKPEIFIGTPPTAFFPEGITEGLSNYNIQPSIVDEIYSIVLEIAREEGYEVIDIHKLTEGRRELFVKDNVHPNNEGAAKIAEAFLWAVK